MPIRTAIVSVYDKRGVGELGRALHEAGVSLLSTGGTARALRDADVPVTGISDHTGSPEILGGRVKTLHPTVHGGILFRRDDAEHQAEVEAHAITPIDLVVVNLYPFRETIAGGADMAEACEQIDIGGPTLLRAAAKNWPHVLVVTDPADYDAALEIVRGEVDAEREGSLRRRLAARAFSHTAAYDSTVAGYLQHPDDASQWPKQWTLAGDKQLDLRYGENPHQSAAFYASGPKRTGLAEAEILQGKSLSYNNLLDADACLRAVEDYADQTACVIVKHTNPCGLATGDNAASAFHRAVACDPVSYFGGIVGLSVPVDAELAKALVEPFLEVVLAPDFTAEAREILRRKKRLRVLRLPEGLLSEPRHEAEVRRVRGGFLVQQPDAGAVDLSKAEVVTQRAPTKAEWASLEFGWKACRHVKSNAIVFARDGQLVGVGAGQMSRVDAARLAATRAHLPVDGSVVASDAFFPFRDGLDELAAGGATAVVQPGGSIRDADVIAAADEHGMAMVFTGRRHFRH